MRGTAEECQDYCNKVPNCYAFNHTDGKCQFVNSVDFMTGKTPGSDLYVKECIDLDGMLELVEDMRKNPDR